MPPKAKDQPVLPAPEFQAPPCAPEVEAAGREYYRLVRERISVQAQEKEAYDRLDAVMAFHNVKEWTWHGVTIKPGPKPKWKVEVEGESDEDGWESDPDQMAIDGTVHDGDEDEGLTPLAKDLTAIAEKAAEKLAASNGEGK